MITNKETQNLILLELLSEPMGDDGKPERTPLLSKEEQDAILKRYKSFGNQEVTHVTTTQDGKRTKSAEEPKIEYLEPDWEYIFEPVIDKEQRKKLIDLFETLDRNRTSLGG